jgi:hypothetical protein
MPGTYTITSTFAIDTSYVDIVSNSGNPYDTIITCSTATVATATQTADDVKISNVTFKHTLGTTGCYAFLMSAADNSTSVYSNVHFRNSAAAPYLSESMYSTTTLGGYWYNCKADNYAFRCADGIDMSANMYDCTAGKRSFFGDNNNNASGTGKLTGYLVRCVGGDESFASCALFGSEISGTLVDCIGGNTSFAVGKPISGTLIRCFGGDNSFAGTTDTYYGSVTSSGLLIDCFAGNGNNYAMGNASCVQSGRFIRCKSLTSPENTSIAGVSTVTVSPSAAWVKTPFSTVNKNLVFTAKATGLQPKLYVRLQRTATVSISVTKLTEAKGTVIRVAAKTNGTSTMAQIKTAIEASGDADALIAVSYPSGGDGSGVLDEITTGTSGAVDYKLINGGGSPEFRGNCPLYPYACIANTTVYPFDNGATYTNSGDTDAITFTLPAALAGYEYTFIDSSNTDTADITITANGTETIGSLGTSAVGNTDNTYGIITIKCVVDGSWVVVDSAGTWS